jgi:bacterial/archaeal transporter family-2 protein
MAQAIPLVIAVVIGAGAAVQTAMLAAVGRERGATEAGWQSILATLCGIAAILAFRAFRGDPPLLPAPLDRAAIHLVVAVLAGGGLILTARGLDPYYIGIGFFGLAFIVAAAALTPRLGVALFVSAVIAGQLLGALTLDQLGAFGGEVRRIDGLRVAGVALLLLGVGLVRGGGN